MILQRRSRSLLSLLVVDLLFFRPGEDRTLGDRDGAALSGTGPSGDGEVISEAAGEKAASETGARPASEPLRREGRFLTLHVFDRATRSPVTSFDLLLVKRGMKVVKLTLHREKPE